MARQRTDLALKEAQTPFDKALAQMAHAVVLSRTGEVDKGISDLCFLLQMSRNARHITSELLGLMYLGEAYILKPEYENTRRIAEELRDLASRRETPVFLGYSYRLLGEVGLHTKTYDAATDFEKAIEIFREIKAENELAKAYSGMGRLHKLRGEYAEARRYLTDALEIFERLGTLIEPDKVRKKLTELPQ